METKMTRTAMEDEALDQVVGGAGPIPYTTVKLNENSEADKAKINYLMNGVCPNYSMMPHTKMLQKVSDIEFNCDICGYKWLILKK